MITGLTPYLNFDNKCEEALNFYARVLGGKVKSMMRVSDGPKEYHQPDLLNLVMHSELELGKTSVFASDSMGHGSQAGTNVSLNMNFDDDAAMDKAFGQLAEGGTVTMAMQDTFWGARFGT